MLVALCIVVFIIQIVVPGVTDAFVLQSTDVLARPWILVSSIFLHASLEHLMYNMLALALFGIILERLIGSKKFIVIFFIAGIVASIASALFYSAALGASGAIFGVLGCLAAIRPKMVVWVYSVPMPMFIATGLWLIIDLFGVFYPSGTANVAHIAGLVFGVAVGLYMRKQYPSEKRVKEKLVREEEIDDWENQYMTPSKTYKIFC